MIGCELDTGWFHLSCVGLASFPAGKWYCQYCVGNQTHHAEERAATPRVLSANQVESRPQRDEKATSPTTTPFQKSKSTSSNLPAVQNAPKGQRPSSKRPDPAVQNLSSRRNVPTKENWKDDEKKYVIAFMQEVINEGETTEKKWAIVSSRLMSRYAVDRSAGSVKNWWNRHGRAMSNIDERIVPKPDKMKTGNLCFFSRFLSHPALAVCRDICLRGTYSQALSHEPNFCRDKEMLTAISYRCHLS